MSERRYTLTFKMMDGTKQSVEFVVPAGEPGYTPVKGVDYFTEADIEETAIRASKIIEVDTEIKTDNTLSIDEDGVLGVNTTDHIGQGNMLPITSEAVYAAAVLYNMAQHLTEAQKAQARQNIGITDDGVNGKDGVSATHSWNGTVLTITSASGTSSADLKGEKGDKGDPGAKGTPGEDGRDGLTPTIEVEENYTSNTGKSGVLIKVTQPHMTENGTSTEIYEFPIYNGTDGKAAKIFSVKVEMLAAGATPSANVTENALGSIITLKIPKSDPGKDGDDGYSPVRGKDYWTPSDIAAIKSYVDEAILGGAW